MPFRRGRTYWCRVKNADGNRIRVSLGTTDRSIAQELEALLKRLTTLRAWDILAAAAARPGGYGELLDHYRREGEALDIYRELINDPDLNAFVGEWKKWAARNAREHTVEKYLRQLRELMPEDIRYNRSNFRRNLISAALHKLTHSGSTVRRYHAAWSSFANFLVERDVIEHNPLRDIRAPKPNAGREVYLDQAEQIRLVEAQPLVFAACAALREGAGVEISAALRVRRRDVSETSGTVFVRGTKNEHRSRNVLVEEWAWPYIRKALANKLPDAHIFEGVTAFRARSQHRVALEACEMRADYRMHDARHSLAVRWMKMGIEPQIIANNLGHRDASLVMKLYGRYRPKDADLRRVRERAAGA